MSRKRQKDLVHEHNVLEIVNHSLSVEKVHGGRQPVPVETLGRSQGAGTAGHVRNGDDFLEGDDLDGGDDADDVDVAHEESREEQGEHDKCPEGAGDKVCLFLLVLGLFLVGGWGFLGHHVSTGLEGEVKLSPTYRTGGRLRLGLGLLRGLALVAEVAKARSSSIGAVLAASAAVGELDPSL